MRLSRRRLLAASGTSLSVGVAGCLTSGGDDGEPSTDPTDEATTTAGMTNADTQTDSATGTDSTTGTDTATATEEPTEDGGATTATVGVRSHPEHGDVLVDADGLTLYMFDNDTKGSASSTCSGDCASNWPPLTVDGEATAGGDVTATLTTFERSDGSTQVAANGWPLYYFASDDAAGDANGQGVGDVWWVLRPDGTPVKPGSSGPGYSY